MVFLREMSRGRTMPATSSTRTSLLTRTSCEPEISTLPLGSTSVTTAATERLSDSLRSIEPWPLVSVPERMPVSAVAVSLSPEMP